MGWSFGALVLGFMLLGQTSFPARIEAIDEGDRDPSFAHFRTELLAAAKRPDLRAVLGAFDPNVRVTPGNRIGIKALEKYWDVRRSPARLFAELKAVFGLGGRLVSADTFIAPYPFTEVPDPPRGMALPNFTVIVRPKTEVLASPKAGSPIIATLNDEVVKYNATHKGWHTVWLANGQTGYVRADATRSPADTHAIVKRKGGKWRITEFSAVID